MLKYTDVSGYCEMVQLKYFVFVICFQHIYVKS